MKSILDRLFRAKGAEFDLERMAGVDERDTPRDSNDGTDSWEEDEQTSDESSREYQPDANDESDRHKYLNKPFSLCQTPPGPGTGIYKIWFLHF